MGKPVRTPIHLEDHHKTGFADPNAVRASLCGLYVREAGRPADQLTDDEAEVTCRSCLRYRGRTTT